MNQMMDFDNKETTQTKISGSLRPVCSSSEFRCENVGTQEKHKFFGDRQVGIVGT